MSRLLRPCLGLFLMLTLLTGVAYPIFVTAMAQLVFPAKADGSVLVRDGRAVGSALLGQPFSSPEYFWGRPSATAPQPYNGAASTGTNQAPTNPALADAVAERVATCAQSRRTSSLACRSTSSPPPAVGSTRTFPRQPPSTRSNASRAHAACRWKVPALVAAHTRGRALGFFGEPRVNVLELNLALDEVR